MSRLTQAFCLMSLCLLAPTLTVASGVHRVFDVASMASRWRLTCVEFA